MFDSILIANRGEIACRVIRTARRMGLRAIAVHSEADAGARHVRLADEAVLIGPAAARESYLVAERIIEAARRTGAKAIHPGYGFLSENADFAETCAREGIIFVGPPPSAIRAMGSKSAAKALMETAGVPLTPGYHGDEQDPDFLKAQADAIGYPVLIKAAAGGGGKGMRLVERGGDFIEALASCRREARASFGDDHVLVEKYVTRPRHIEIQVFGDSHGNYVHLFERDCSVQRRHQKVVEEAPAPGMTPERRHAMGEAAVAAARAVGYAGAGTVEFIANQDGTFYFMEMNTRLQVEHPVTEMITGQDLVEWQLRVAAGEALPLSQAELGIQGHALEARIYAEDADRGFLPSIGRLAHVAAPAEGPHVRIDTGVEEGDEITPHYDPMVAKLIVWDEDRDAALARMRRALADYRVAGVTTNIPFLSRLIACPAFAEADLDTGLIERERDALFPPATVLPRDALLAAAAAELLAERATSDNDPWGLRDDWRLNMAARRSLQYRAGDETFEIAVVASGNGWSLTLAGETAEVAASAISRGAMALTVDGRRFSATVVALGTHRQVFLGGGVHALERDDPLAADFGAASGGGRLTAPMPGKVVALLAEAGSAIEAGQPLLILEAMKMEHTIKAPGAGVLSAYHFAVGDQVAEGDALAAVETEA
ncbi:acetyl/propionyl/methylcrotonyl-CoA carboxylase subunit alpha [Zavarzinia compransoris]|uniref:acetyl-CoA carboxylase biotin carboxylase subunit n=1 Tax=Zavarzinia marina TaxID=2911065 RepID=UPI001F3365D4|nr:acetyl/propionyl/methylcrotonyl-CoA carboxylase subunit alpha [Zavarzinia marina]MCF4165758.1 acetyl/propionyl/methylcrotonyl-CoA carboxylase subunit alpha [Zavarzinia marina]